MKFAIASDDGKKIAAHFGRTRGFVIFESKDGEIVDRQYVDNTFTGHAQGGHDHNHEHGHSHEHAQHQSHGPIISALSGCDAVVSHGMGQRLYIDLTQNNIRPYITNETDVDSAARLMLENRLDDNPGRGCHHKHGA
ncbi:MAG: NifB/NifX family molybdenum-iron cluster-binding protein [Candidatus Kapaibacterium sp.]